MHLQELQLLCIQIKKILIILLRRWKGQYLYLSNVIVKMAEKIEHNKLIEALKTVYDPEIPVDIYELGLIYGINEEKDNNIKVTMTLTAPGCPVAEEMPKWVEDAVKQVDGVKNVSVEMVFDPPWDMSLMSDEARLTLNMF
jgi:FeS assembly SUF system protein